MQVSSNSSGRSPLVSVIIPVFNDPGGLADCLAGLRGQRPGSDAFEVIAVDNGSSPPLRLDDACSVEVRVIYCGTPGSYAARNAGVAAARGEILAFTDADCVPDPNWIAKGIESLRDGSGKFIVGGEVVFTAPDTLTGTALYQLVSGFQQEANIVHKGFSATANLFCTARQFRAVGPFDEQLLSGGDREWCWRAAKRDIALRFERESVVTTLPRVRLKDAIRQARRVAAGRIGLNTHASLNPGGLKRRRSSVQSMMWIASLSNLSIWQRLRVLGAATMIRLASVVESMRLRFGSTAERR